MTLVVLISFYSKLPRFYFYDIQILLFNIKYDSIYENFYYELSFIFDALCFDNMLHISSYNSILQCWFYGTSIIILPTFSKSVGKGFVN